jgi:hypothetical protein
MLPILTVVARPASLCLLSPKILRKRRLLIVAEDTEEEVPGTLVVNKLRGGLKVVARYLWARERPRDEAGISAASAAGRIVRYLPDLRPRAPYLSAQPVPARSPALVPRPQLHLHSNWTTHWGPLSAAIDVGVWLRGLLRNPSQLRRPRSPRGKVIFKDWFVARSLLCANTKFRIVPTNA